MCCMSLHFFTAFSLSPCVSDVCSFPGIALEDFELQELFEGDFDDREVVSLEFSV